MGKTTTGVLLSTFCALALFIALYERGTVATSEISARADRALDTFVRERVTRIELTRGRERVVLERTPSSVDDADEPPFRMTAPVRSETDEDAVNTLLFAVDFANARRKLGAVPEVERRTFGLDTPKIRARFSMDRRAIGIAIGNEDPRGEGVYLLRDDTSEVFVVGKDLFEALDHDAGHFRTKLPFGEMDVAHATSITFTDTRGAFTLRDQGGQWMSDEAGPSSVRADAVESLLRAAEDLRIRRYIVDRPRALESYGLKPASKTLLFTPRPPTVADGGSAGGDYTPRTLALGNTCEGHPEERYGRIDEGPIVCFLAEDLRALDVDPRSWTEPADAGATATDASNAP